MGADEHDDFLEELLKNIGDEWDGDEAAESIAVSYVRHLEDEVRRLGGDFRPSRYAEEETADHPVTSRCECGGLARHIERCRWRQGYGSVQIAPLADAEATR